MIFKILFFIIVLLSFNSCNQSKKTQNDKINDMSISNNTFIETDENYKRQILIFVKNYIPEGYYVYHRNIIYLTQNENTVTMQSFNKINGKEIYDEIITFNILHDNIKHEIIGEGYNRLQRRISTVNNENIFNQLDLTTEKRRWVDGSLKIKKDGYAIYAATWWDYPQFITPEDNSMTTIPFLFETMNEKVNKYTYDFQKQYIGTYIYDSYKLFDIETDEFNNKYNNENEKTEKIINIDDDGFLFLDDGFGRPRYTVGDDIPWGTKIINEDERAILFGNHPAYGKSVELYFLGGDIIWEVELGHDDIMKYYLIF